MGIIRKPKKENMLSHVVIACIFVLGIVGILIATGHHAEHLSIDFIYFFQLHLPVLVYIVLINLITFLVFAVDKRKAVKGKQRIRVLTLMNFSFVGGSVGGMLAMKLFRHKTQTKHFTIGLPIMFVTQMVVLLYAMNLT